MIYFSATANLRIVEEQWHRRGRRTRYADFLCHLRVPRDYSMNHFRKKAYCIKKRILLFQSTPLSQSACFCYSLVPVLLVCLLLSPLLHSSFRIVSRLSFLHSFRLVLASLRETSYWPLDVPGAFLCATVAAPATAAPQPSPLLLTRIVIVIVIIL